MRSIGQGHSSLKIFTALMNMPSPMTPKNYDRSVKTITDAVVNVAEETMSRGCRTSVKRYHFYFLVFSLKEYQN